MSSSPTNDTEFNLQQVLLLMNHLTKWLIRSGVGYTEFSAALKPIFYLQAVNELETLEKKPLYLQSAYCQDCTVKISLLSNKQLKMANY